MNVLPTTFSISQSHFLILQTQIHVTDSDLTHVLGQRAAFYMI